jgi:adenylosuccinate synthase
MAVSVVVGGQYGSEGKGKVAHYVSHREHASAVVRVGGSNSGHTSVTELGDTQVLRQLPTAALLDEVRCVLGPGSYVDPPILLDEIDRLGLDRERVCVDYRAMVITEADRQAERASSLQARIGSTCSGTGAAVQRRIARQSVEDLALGFPALRDFIGDSTALLRQLLDSGERVVVEGTQGHGLSLLQSAEFPYVTSRDTSAAGAVSEAGLSPLDVDQVVLVIRSFPIRVAGHSGPFGAEEVDWETVAEESGLPATPRELTSVTQRVRRVARFDADLVRRAIQANQPTTIALNHIDYVDAGCSTGEITAKAAAFVEDVEHQIGAPVDVLGFVLIHEIWFPLILNQPSWRRLREPQRPRRERQRPRTRSRSPAEHR